MGINISGHRYPSAHFALHGITLLPIAKLYEMTKGLADGIPDTRKHLLVKTAAGTHYRLYPNTSQSQSDPHVAYYMAYNVSSSRTEYVVGGLNWPDIFAVEADNYARAAQNFYNAVSGSESEYELASKLVTYYMMKGQPGTAARMLGRAWLEALQDPDFWIQIGVSAGMSKAANVVANAVLNKVAERTANIASKTLVHSPPPPPTLPPSPSKTIIRSPPPPPIPKPSPYSPPPIIRSPPPPPPRPTKGAPAPPFQPKQNAPLHPNQPPPISSGRVAPETAALVRLRHTADNLLDKSIVRTSSVLNRPTVFRHVVTGDVPVVSVLQIKRAGSMRYSDGAKAHYGEGVYAWGPGRVGNNQYYIDIEIPAGVAVERIVVKGREPMYRFVTASGNNVPVRVVGTNITKEEFEQWSKLLDK